MGMVNEVDGMLDDDDRIAWWVYRVLRQDYDEESSFRMIECYLNREGKIVGWCEASAMGGNEEELASDLRAMLEVATRIAAGRDSVVTLDDLPGPPVMMEEDV